MMILFMPFLFSALILAPIGINKSNLSQTTVKVYDESNILADFLIKNYQDRFVKYEVLENDKTYNEAIDFYDKDDAVMVLRIPSNIIKNQAPVVELYNQNSPGKYVISKVKNDLFDIRKKLLVFSTTKFDLHEFEQKMNSPVSVIVQGEGMNPRMKFFLSLSASLLLYWLIIMYGVQVMRGVMEEKGNRIIEILAASVKPKTLLRGKVLGIGLAGLLQFIGVAIFSGTVLVVFSSIFGIDADELFKNQMQFIGQSNETAAAEEVSIFSTEVDSYMSSLAGYIPILLLVVPVLFFLGYFLYATLFAAVGSALDQDTDTQQFVLPITIPLLLAGAIAFNILEHPNSDLAFWASQFPLTSPVVMTARLAFMDLSTDWWQLVSCILLLIATIWLASIASGKIYRTGILMYGQKVNYATFWRWFRQKD